MTQQDRATITNEKVINILLMGHSKSRIAKELDISKYEVDIAISSVWTQVKLQKKFNEAGFVKVQIGRRIAIMVKQTQINRATSLEEEFYEFVSPVDFMLFNSHKELLVTLYKNLMFFQRIIGISLSKEDHHRSILLTGEQQQ